MFLGVTTLSLVSATGKAYEKIKSSADASARLRIASSYLSMRVRQADEKGLIRFEENPVGSGNALVISSNIDGNLYETWIFYSEGALREAFIPRGISTDMSAASEIVKLEKLTINPTNNKKGIVLGMAAGYLEPAKYIDYKLTLHLRAGN